MLINASKADQAPRKPSRILAGISLAPMGKRVKHEDPDDGHDHVAMALARAAQRATRIAQLDAAHEPQLPEDHVEEEDTQRPVVNRQLQ